MASTPLARLNAQFLIVAIYRLALELHEQQKRSSRAKHILRPARASIAILYQTRAER